MVCAIGGCGKGTAGKSKYCRDHRAEARARWKDMISAKADERDSRNARYAALFAEARKAGLDAGNGLTPRPMVVTAHENPLDDHSRVDKSYYVSEGVCGFAWVRVKDRSFGHWLKKNGLGKTDSYAGGVTIWIGEHGQSYERKHAHAIAMADKLCAGGVLCFPGSRLD